jgi:hypothetical protein
MVILIQYTHANTHLHTNLHENEPFKIKTCFEKGKMKRGLVTSICLYYTNTFRYVLYYI